MTTGKTIYDVPLIEYLSLANSPTKRLKALRGLAFIINKPLGLHRFNVEEVTEEEWKILRSWLLSPDTAGEALSFWRAEPHGVRVLRACKGHVLVGTGQLLDDLLDAAANTVSLPDEMQTNRRNQSTSGPLSDALWRAARSYVAEEMNI